MTALALEVDGENLLPSSKDDFNAFGVGNATAVFDASRVLGAKEVVIVASIASQYQLKVKLAKDLLKQLGEPSASATPTDE